MHAGDSCGGERNQKKNFVAESLPQYSSYFWYSRFGGMITMERKTIIIRLDNSFIYVNGSVKLDYDNSNLPKQYFQFSNDRLIKFEVEQTDYNKESGTLKVRVVNYTPKFNTDLNAQDPRFPIHKIEFEKMDWKAFSQFIYSYKFNRIKDIFFNADESFISPANKANDALKQRIQSDSEYWQSKAPNLFFQQARTPVTETLSTEVNVKFEDAVFDDGWISFTARLKGFKAAFNLSIENPNLKKEFEHIKPWFEKKIGKAFEATIHLTLFDGQFQEASATSAQIAGINEILIESIRIHRVEMLVRLARRKDNDKSVFTTEEVFGILDQNNAATNILNSSVHHVIEILIRNGLVKNIRQLEYLSGDKQSLNERLRFTLKPHFGFLFKVDTPMKQFFIWELLNSHATYVWEKRSGDEEFYNFIEKEISFIKQNGREAYRRHYKNLAAKDFAFHLIEHEASDLTQEERFQAWKNKLDTLTNLSKPAGCAV